MKIRNFFIVGTGKNAEKIKASYFKQIISFWKKIHTAHT